MNEITLLIKAPCSICGFPILKIEEDPNVGDILHCYCSKCGEYYITDEAKGRLPKDRDQKLAISAFIALNQKIKIKSQDVERLSRLPKMITPEKAETLLMIIPGKSIPNIWKRYSRLVDFVRKPDFKELAQKEDISYLEILNTIARCQIIDVAELIYITEKY